MEPIELSNGAAIFFQKQLERWVIRSKTGTITDIELCPNHALLLLEECYPFSAVRELPDFPFDSIIQAAYNSGLTRYQVLAERWHRALFDLNTKDSR